MAATGKRKILTLDDRVDVLKRIDNGEPCRSIAAAVNCGKTQISRIRNDRAAIMKVDLHILIFTVLFFFKILKRFILVQYIYCVLIFNTLYTWVPNLCRAVHGNV